MFHFRKHFDFIICRSKLFTTTTNKDPNRRIDVGLSHVALTVTNIQKSLLFYSEYANMKVVHKRTDAESQKTVVWLSDGTRPFAIVLMETPVIGTILKPFSHLGVGCKTRQEVDALCEKAKKEGILIQAPQDSGYPIGYWAFLR